MSNGKQYLCKILRGQQSLFMGNVKEASPTNIKILLTVINDQKTGSFNRRTITIWENINAFKHSNKKGSKNQIVTAFSRHVFASPNAIVNG